MARRETPKVLLFLAEGFEDLEAVTILDVCGWTEYRDHIPTVRVTTTGFHNEIRGRFGLVIGAEVPFSKVDPADYSALALPGGFHARGFDEAYDERLHHLARPIHVQGGIIATFCIGILPVAEAGLLNGKRATTYPHSRNHDNLRRLRELGAIVMNEPIVVDDRIISCQGPAQAFEVAFLLLENLIGAEEAAEVGRFMMYEQKPHSARKP